jgi:ATP sulfurylase
LNEVEQTEKEFKAMFDYLNECEEMLGAEECDQIKELIDVSGTRVKGHTDNYEELMRKVQEL